MFPPKKNVMEMESLGRYTCYQLYKQAFILLAPPIKWSPLNQVFYKPKDENETSAYAICSPYSLFVCHEE